VSIVTDPDWREVEFGEWEGQVIDDVIAHSPADVRAWRSSTAVRPPGGESLDEMTRRVLAARDRTLARFDGDPAIVVTHSMPIRSLVVEALGAPSVAIHNLRPGTGSMTEFRFAANGDVVVSGFSVS
jgi:probable phosphoglycerate mutase